MKSCENCAHLARSGPTYSISGCARISYKKWYGEAVCAHPTNLNLSPGDKRIVIPYWTPEELRAMPDIQSKLLSTCGKDGRYYEPAIFRDGDFEDGQTPCTEASADKFSNGEVPKTGKRPAYNTFLRVRNWISKPCKATRQRRTGIATGIAWLAVLAGFYFLFLTFSYYVNPR